MNLNQITWKDAFSHKYVILCLICGGLLLTLGFAFIIIYLIISSYTSSLHYFETLPTYIPAITLVVNGLVICILAKSHLRYFYLIKISGAFCLICALMCVVTTVTITVIHLNRLQSLQGCEYTASSSTCICMTTGSTLTASSNDPSDQVSGQSNQYAFQSIPNCDVVHGVLNTCLRALFGVSVFGILISIFTSMLVYQLMSHEKKKKYLEQLESRRRFHQHAFSRRGHDPLGPPPPFPILSYPPPHALAAQGCSAFMDDMFYPTGNVPPMNGGGSRGGWMWPPPPPPPWDLIDYRSYCTPSYDSHVNPCTNLPNESSVPGESNHRTDLLAEASRNVECPPGAAETNEPPRSFFSGLFSRYRRQRRAHRNPSQRLLSRDRSHGQSGNSTDCTGALVTENRFNHRSLNRYGHLSLPHSPPLSPLSPTLPPPHHPLLPGTHFSPLLVPLHPSYRFAASAIRSRSLARLNARRTRSNDAIFHHLHSMAYAHPPPPPFFQGPPLLGSPQSLFATWGPPPPYSQPSSVGNVSPGHNNNSNEVEGGVVGEVGSTDYNSDTSLRRPVNTNASRHNQITNDGYDCSSKLSTPISERRMLCNAFSSDGITLTIGGPRVTSSPPSKSSCIVEVHVSDEANHDVPSESKMVTFNTIQNGKSSDNLSSYHHPHHRNQQVNHPNHQYSSYNNNNLSENKQFPSNHLPHHQPEPVKSIDTIIYEHSNESNEPENFNCVMNGNYLDKEEPKLTNIDLKQFKVPSANHPGEITLFGSVANCLNSSASFISPVIRGPETEPRPMTRSDCLSPTISTGSSTNSTTRSSSSNATYLSSPSSESNNLFSSTDSPLDESKSISQPMSASHLNLGYKRINIGEERTIELGANGEIYLNQLHHRLQSNPSSIIVDYGNGETGEKVCTLRPNLKSSQGESGFMVIMNNEDDQVPVSDQSSSSNDENETSSNSDNNNKNLNYPDSSRHQSKENDPDEPSTRQEIKYMQTQSMPNLSYAAAVSPVAVAVAAAAAKAAASPSHHPSSGSSSCQITPQHVSKDSYHPSSGNTSTSQDIADLELEMDEEPLCYLPDLPYDDSRFITINPNTAYENSEQSITPRYHEISTTKIKPPTPFANCPPSSDSSRGAPPSSSASSSESSSTKTISENLNSPGGNHHQQPTSAVVGDNIIVTIRSIQV